MTSRSDLARLLLDVRYGRKSLATLETTANFTYPASTATALIQAANTKEINLSGTINGPLSIRGTVEGRLTIHSDIRGKLHVYSSAKIKGGLHITGTIEGRCYIEGTVEDEFSIRDTATIKGGLYIGAVLKDELHIRGTIEGRFYIRDIAMITGKCYLNGLFKGLCIFKSEMNIFALKGSFEKPVDFNDHINLSECDFRGFPSFDNCEFSGSALFNRERTGTRNLFSHKRERRQKIEIKFDDTELPFSSQVSIYRQLRRVYETSGNRPGASDFYFREMEARQNLLREEDSRFSLEYATLFLYKHLSSYGLNPYRAATWFFTLIILGAVGFGIEGVSLTETSIDEGFIKEAGHNRIASSGFLPLHDMFDLFIFSFKSMVSFFSPPKADLSNWETGLQIVLRFLGPILLAQTILATREKVAR